jgi:hypothetical protein
VAGVFCRYSLVSLLRRRAAGDGTGWVLNVALNFIVKFLGSGGRLFPQYGVTVFRMARCGVKIPFHYWRVVKQGGFRGGEHEVDCNLLIQRTDGRRTCFSAARSFVNHHITDAICQVSRGWKRCLAGFLTKRLKNLGTFRLAYGRQGGAEMIISAFSRRAAARGRRFGQQCCTGFCRRVFPTVVSATAARARLQWQGVCQQR